MKKFLQGVAKVAKAIWKPVAIVGGILAAVFIGTEVVRGIRASFGTVVKQANWMPVPGDKSKIAIVDTAGKAQTVTLPTDANGKQITSDQVAAAGLGSTGKWTVQLKAENVFGSTP